MYDGGQMKATDRPLPKPRTSVPEPTHDAKLAKWGAPVTKQEMLELIVEYRGHYVRSVQFYHKVIARRREIRERILAEQATLARAGNVQAKQAVKNPELIDIILDRACPSDPAWLAYVAEQQFAERLANLSMNRIKLETYLVDNGWL